MPRFSPEFLDEIRNRLKPSDVIGRKVKLKRRGDTWWGLSPFKEEKTPSFTVSDRRGTYHCFATQKHGNIFDFLMETERLSFPEAVERLAREAGLEPPQSDPGEAERIQRKKGLLEACEAAADFYEAMLRRAPGRAAADYLKGRGVSDALIKEFRLGYAPDGGRVLKDYLVNKGYTEEVLLDAGLIARSEDGGRDSYDRFRHRVMFPILGGRGEVIAFGGRALDPNARAKYLNSPETALFHKGDVLYSFGRARTAATSAKKPLIVCEGYMDVIALFGAGFEQAVAPLGTALGEAQLAMLWRHCDEPALCFDGDKAGIAAAYRSLDRALPLLRPGKSLNYVFLPDGQDPDDVVRAGGAEAFQKALDAAVPLAEALWRREVDSRPLDTPERRAALKSALRQLVALIVDPDVRRAYGEDMGRRLDALFAPAPGREGGERRDAGGRRPSARGARFAPPAPRPSARLLRQKGPSAWAREATLVLAAINHPGLVERREADFFGLVLDNPDLDRLLKAALTVIAEAPTLDTEGLKRHLQRSDAAKTLERVLGDETLNRQSFLRAEAGLDEVEKGWADALRHHLIATEARKAMAESAARSFTSGDEVWKAAVLHREELINAKADQDAAADADVTSRDLEDRLDRMRTSVGAKRKAR
jgi:DNA primase